MKITKEELMNVKEEIFNKYISEEEKENIINEINTEVSKILIEFEENKKEEIDIDE